MILAHIIFLEEISKTLFLIYLIKLTNITEVPPYGGPFAKDVLLQKEALIVGNFPNRLPTMGAT